MVAATAAAGKQVNKEMLEEKIGECLGLERAAQKAVQEFETRGMLDKPEVKKKVDKVREEAREHEEKLRDAAEKVAESEELDMQGIEEHARETEEKAAQMMQTYVGDKKDTLVALEFLGLAEGGEVVHYEVLSKMAGKVKSKRFGTAVRSILTQEKRHLQSCIALAKQQSMASAAGGSSGKMAKESAAA
jgi:hypothetical protein